MRGLIFSFRKRFMILARITPPAVPKPKATKMCIRDSLGDEHPLEKRGDRGAGKPFSLYGGYRVGEDVHLVVFGQMAA